MKRIAYILSILITFAICFSCEGGNITKLKNKIRSLNAMCPIKAGISGDIISFRYNEKDGNVYMDFLINEDFGSQFFLKDSNEIILTNIKLMLQGSDSHQLLNDMLNAKAGLMMTYKIITSGKTAQFEIPYEELKEIKDHPISEQERLLNIINNKLALENSRYPIELEEGLIMVKNELFNDNLIFYIQVDEDLYDFKELKKSQKEIRENRNQFFQYMKGDPTMQREFELLTKAGLGYHYRYFGNKSNDYFDIIFTPEDLSTYMVK